VISGIGSGVGKTTVATGLMAALRKSGMRVSSAKVGPDFIDPSYHSVATGRPGRSLDAWLAGEDLLAPMAASAAEGADVLIVEGVMGMFDGSGQPEVDGSTADVARRLDAPVILVVDVWTMSSSVAAVVHGFRSLDPRVEVAGVILNRVAGEGHATLCREALDPLGIPVLGAIPQDDDLTWRERHLGLVPVAEQRDEVRAAVERIGAAMSAHCDLAALARIARSASPLATDELPSARRVGAARIALASGPSFSFVYPENLALFEQAGAEMVRFDPLVEKSLPEGCDALYAGGGFPEVFAGELAENRSLNDSVRDALRGGMVAWAECGGLLWLCETLDDTPMVGAIATKARMTDRLTIGYRSATTRVRSPLGPVGTTLRGHEFHRTVTEPAGDALEVDARFGSGRGGFASDTIFAGYLHQLLVAAPELAERFVLAAGAVAAKGAAAGSQVP